MENPNEVDLLSRAWAAGVFDGEGTASGYVPQNRRARTVQITVYQGTTPLLERFRSAMGGHGRVHGPYRDRLYHWTTKRRAAVEAVCLGLWPSLGEEKRRQLEAAVLGHDRFEALVAGLRAADTSPQRTWKAELAWAAGFFDGEGSVTLRAAGAPSIEISQASMNGEPAGSLLRFRSAVGSLGHISGPRMLRNRWSKLPQYRWQAASFEHAQAVIAMLWPWLGAQKRRELSAAQFKYVARKRRGRA
jgi:hypothetical protein